MTRKILTAVVLAIGAIGCSAATAPKTSSGYQGVYITSKAIRNNGRSELVENLVQSAASGTFIRINWDAIEAQPGKYDWSQLDAIAVPAANAGKNLSIGIVAGAYAPMWLGDDKGVRYSSFSISQRRCESRRIYWPWETTYQDSYLNLMRSLKQHLSEIGAYSNLKIVKMSFVAQQTLELRLPRRRAGTYQGCQIDDAPSIWMKAGYTPRRVLASYDRVVKILARDIFPDKIISQATQKGDSFPDIGENGQIVPDGEADAPLVTGIIRSCVAAAPARCAVQNQSLQTLGPVGDRVVDAAQGGAIVGFQTALNRGRARCQPNTDRAVPRLLKGVERTPCTDQGYEQVLNKGVAAGARYLEVWPQDVRDFPDVIKKIDLKMRS